MTRQSEDTPRKAGARTKLRGRPMFEQPPRVWWDAFWAAVGRLGPENIGLVSAGVAFFGMLALFPGLAAVISIWGLLGDPSVARDFLQEVGAILPGDARSLIEHQLDDLIAASGNALGWTSALSLLIALWSARSGTAALMNGVNAIYRERQRGGVRHTAVALLLTLILIAVALVALFMVVVVPIGVSFLDLGTYGALVIEAARWLIVFAVIQIGVALLYRYGPNRRAARIPWITPGAIVSIALWLLASFLFSAYLANFGRYNEIYGSIGAVVAMLVWLYLSAFLLLFGALLNAELERRTRADSTVGPDRPMGERGATVADDYVDVPK